MPLQKGKVVASYAEACEEMRSHNGLLEESGEDAFVPSSQEIKDEHDSFTNGYKVCKIGKKDLCYVDEEVSGTMKVDEDGFSKVQKKGKILKKIYIVLRRVK